MAGLHTYRRVIGGGKSSGIAVRGNFVMIRSQDAPCRVEIQNNQTGDKSGEKYTLNMSTGEKWYAAHEFDQVNVINVDEDDNANADQTVDIVIGYGDYLQPPPNKVVADFYTGYGPVDCAVVAPVALAPENAARHRVIVKADILNDGIVAIGPNAEDLTHVPPIKYLPLGPGESATFECKGLLVGWEIGAGSTSIVYVISEDYNVA